MEFWLVVLGVLAGGLTTVAGMGGGVMLVLALSLVASPVEALAITSPALLVGNLHRVAVGRRAIDRAVARPFVLGALPGSLLGGLVAVAVPPALLQSRPRCRSLGAPPHARPDGPRRRLRGDPPPRRRADSMQQRIFASLLAVFGSSLMSSAWQTSVTRVFGTA